MPKYGLFLLETNFGPNWNDPILYIIQGIPPCCTDFSKTVSDQFFFSIGFSLRKISSWGKIKFVLLFSKHKNKT